VLRTKVEGPDRWGLAMASGQQPVSKSQLGMVCQKGAGGRGYRGKVRAGGPREQVEMPKGSIQRQSRKGLGMVEDRGQETRGGTEG